MASQTAKPRARRASRVPLGKSLSVDESVLSSTGLPSHHPAAASSAFGRPSSMLARASSSSGAVLNPANANGLSSANPTTAASGITQKMKASSLSQGGLNNGKLDGKLAGNVAPRRVLGDLSNANKLLDNRGGKEGGGPTKDGKPVVRVRSSTSTSLSSRPLAPKSSSAVSNTTAATVQNNTAGPGHSRANSTASRHSVLSQKSSHSSLNAQAAAIEHRRVRTASDNAASVPAPGAPRIGTGSWQAKAEQEEEELLDTVTEGNSYTSQTEGLGISLDGGKQLEEDEVMDQAGSSGGDTSNDTFELDLDAAYEDAKVMEAGMQVDSRPATIPEYEDEYDTAARLQKTIKSPSQKIAFNGKTAKREEARDPNDWLSLTNSAQRAAERRIDEIVEVFEDKPDLMDTSMVAEYSEEIFAYMEELEIESMPNPNYMDSQSEIEWPMRATLIDWLLQVHMRYHMLPETLWITINIVDRFLSNRVVSLVKLQLVGITAMFVAAKYEEIMAPSVDEFVYMTENNYSREEILKGERIILASLEFKVSNYCSPYSWMRRISKADEYDVQTRTLSKFLMEVTLLDHRFLRCKPSTIAAVGMYLARRMLGGDWNESFIFYSRHTESQLAQPTSLVLSAIAADDFEDKFVYQKYSVKKHLKASIFARQWAKATLESATRAHELSMK